MSAVTTPLLPSDLFRLSVKQYHELIESGVIASDEPVELVDGILFQKISKNPPHSSCNGRIQKIISDALIPGWCFRLQEPVQLEDGQPEPDGAVAIGSIDDYAAKHPRPADLALIIEVADSSLDRDRRFKLPAYARAGIPAYWIINLIDQQIEVYTRPSASAKVSTYIALEIFKPGDLLPFKIGEQLIAEISVTDILPI